MGYVSPGRLYLEKRKTIETFDDVLAYAEFLREEAGLNGVLPVDLNKIFERFQIPEPKSAPLPQQQGLLLDAERGIIVINSKDPEKRQKFTKAHELTEILFDVLPQGKDLFGGWRLDRPGGFKKSTKEFLCNWTAANLLMPTSYVNDQIEKLGANFDCARSIADKCEVSLSAALVQVARNSKDGLSVVLWRMKNKPTELRNRPPDGQMSMFNMDNVLPPKKLRVEWCMSNEHSPFIPQDKSVGEDTLIYQAWQSDAFTTGRERLTFDNRASSWYTSENMPFTLLDERYVISLIKKG